MANDNNVLGMLVDKIGSANWNQWQVQRWSWWDYVRVTNTGALNTSLNFFSNPLGSSDPVSAAAKTLEQTNMVKPNTFGQQYFIIQQIRTQLRPLVKARQTANTAALASYSYDQIIISNKLRNAFQTGVFNLVIGQKAYIDIPEPFRACPPGFGVSQVVVPFDRTIASTGNAYLEQSSDMSDIFALTPPQLIEPEQTFQCTIDFPDLAYNFAACFNGAAENCNIEAGVIFDGYLARPVQ